jgi:hypothetical protein
MEARFRGRRPSPSLVISIVALFVALGGTSYAALTLPRDSVGSRQIKTGAVGGSEVRDGALKLKDFGDEQFPAGARGPVGAGGSAGPLGPAGPAGPAGLAGRNGTNGFDGQDGRNGADGRDGAIGPRGPSDAYLGADSGSQTITNSAIVTVPAGDYVAAASGQALYFRSDSTSPATEGETTCTLRSAEDPAHDTGTFATVPSHGFSAGTQRGGVATVSQNSAFHLPSGGTITYTCSNAPSGTTDPAATIEYTNMRITAIQVGALH